jgi:hypothetical protein
MLRVICLTPFYPPRVRKVTTEIYKRINYLFLLRNRCSSRGNSSMVRVTAAKDKILVPGSLVLTSQHGSW